MGFLERRQPRQQHLAASDGQRAHGQNVVVVADAAAVGGKPEIVERARTPGRYSLAPASAPVRGFCRTNRRTPSSSSSRRILVADRGLRDVQFGSRIGEAQMRAPLEGAQSLSDGSRAVIFGQPVHEFMSCEAAQSVVCRSLDSADIRPNRLASGDEDVHFHT